jgi:Flp pilus assembly protein TadD
MLDSDWPRAERELTHALELDSNDPAARLYLTMLSIVLQRRDGARRAIGRCIELNPGNVSTWP